LELQLKYQWNVFTLYYIPSPYGNESFGTVMVYTIIRILLPVGYGVYYHNDPSPSNNIYTKSIWFVSCIWNEILYKVQT
jgi:hypothetical protein